MKKIKKKNPYIYYTIALGIICLLLISWDYYESNKDIFDVQGFKIPKDYFQKFLNVSEGKPMELCNIDTGKCIMFQRAGE